MRSIRRIKRTTFSAWSLMMTTFGLVIAAMLPYCGIIGRNVLTSSFESTYCAEITRVTSSSPAISRGFVERIAALFGERLLLHANDAARLDRGEPMHAQHREEQLVDVVLVEARVRDHGDFALHARVDDEGLAGDRGDLRDELVDVGVLEIDLPRLFLRDRRCPTTINIRTASKTRRSPHVRIDVELSASWVSLLQ